jgi:hypothetical protein
MILGQVFERFVAKSPVSVMVRGLLETILAALKLDELFENTTETQYTKALLFSTVVEMMNTVACGIRPSIHAAYQSQKEQMNVSVTSVYNKLNGLAALRSVHGIEKIEQEVSNYYLVDEIRGTYRGMMIAIPDQEWQVFNSHEFDGFEQNSSGFSHSG